MFVYEHRLRVRYAETDRMGYAYYGNYCTYFEVARVEALRSIGINYKDLEDDGIVLPVKDYQVNFLQPAYYDEELLIKTYIKEFPRASILFTYETFNQEGVLLNEASTTLVFFDSKRKRPCRAPENVLKQLEKHLKTIAS